MGKGNFPAHGDQRNGSRLRQDQALLRFGSDFAIGYRSLFGIARDRYGARPAAVFGRANINRQIPREIYR